MTFSSCLSLFIEKLLLARLSTQAMEIAVSAAYACQIFQAPCVALAMMAQVYVGRWYGAQEWRSIGPGIWQFIWFSCLAMVLIAPFSWMYGKFYFHESSIGAEGLSYFYFLVGISFLFPVGAALSSFYFGQGKTKLVLLATLASQLIKIVTAYLFIFGWNDWIPKLGLVGGVVSTLIAQASFCVFLGVVFCNSKQAALYQSRDWHFKPRLFWECIHPGLLRAMNRILNFASWASIARLMTMRGGDYLLSLSIGGTLFIFLPFLGDAVCQAQTTIVSQILGAQRYSSLKKAFRSGSILVTIIVVLVSIPLLLFPVQTFHLLFPKVALNVMDIQKIFLGIWLSFTFFTFGFVPISYVLAFKDTKFSLVMGFVNWINGFLLMYFALEIVRIEANQFWLVLTLMHFSTFVFYWLRMKRLTSSVPSHSLPQSS
jgi:MATE family multidrug resistance protein